MRSARRNTNNLRYVNGTTLMAESREELKSLLMRMKKESQRSRLKLNIKKNEDHGIWPQYFVENRREKSGNSDRFLLLGL